MTLGDSVVCLAIVCVLGVLVCFTAPACLRERRQAALKCMELKPNASRQECLLD